MTENFFKLFWKLSNVLLNKKKKKKQTNRNREGNIVA